MRQSSTAAASTACRRRRAETGDGHAEVTRRSRAGHADATQAGGDGGAGWSRGGHRAAGWVSCGAESGKESTRLLGQMHRWHARARTHAHTHTHTHTRTRYLGPGGVVGVEVAQHPRRHALPPSESRSRIRVSTTHGGDGDIRVTLPHPSQHYSCDGGGLPHPISDARARTVASHAAESPSCIRLGERERERERKGGEG